MAVAINDSDALDESVTITHTASGGGYNGTATRLRVAVSDDERAGTDYDADEDGLIEISTLAQLNAMRWDLDGDGSPSSGNAAAYHGAGGAFAGASAGMGCPAVSGTATCTGYELTRDLDFDTDGDGSTWVDNGGTIESDSDDAYHNGGSGWDPIGPNATPSDTAHFNAEFDGNGHSIHNLFINRDRNYNGLFAVLRGAARVHSLGLPNVRVQDGQGSVAPLAGALWGRVAAVWTSGAVRGNTNVGGLVGATAAGSTIVASHSQASVACDRFSHYAAGGLVGGNGGVIEASYAIGAVTGEVCLPANQNGLVAGGDGTATASYWDTEASGVSISAQGAGRTTSQLQGLTSAIGDYAGWDRLDLDGDGEPNEAPWDFGSASQYPALTYRGMDAVPQRGDYDLDDDGLIEIRTLAQLNAMRWDLDGDGAPSSGSEKAYAKAFRSHRADMGCPTDGEDADDNDCSGYELDNDLDFDTDGDGSTWVDNGGTITSDSDDAYHNGGDGWEPIGPASAPSDATHFNAEFDGNGHSIRNLFIDRRRNYSGLFAALRGGATVHSLGLPNARVQGGLGSVASLAGALWGRVAAVWATGAVSGWTNVGGLAGSTAAGSTIVASYSRASAACGQRTHYAAGGLVGTSEGAVAASYATGAVTGETCLPANRHGLVAGGGGTVTASYWDADLSGIDDDSDSMAPEGRSTADLQAPRGYTGLYAAWDDQDVDGDGVFGESPDDDAWDFGLPNQHPVLKFGGHDTALQFSLQQDSAPVFDGTLEDRTFRNGHDIAAFQAPATSGGNGVHFFAASGLPPGLEFDGDGTGRCRLPRAICGRPTTDGAYEVTITVSDADGNRQAGDSATLTFTITITSPSASIIATHPAPLAEASLDGARLVLRLADSAFRADAAPAHFSLVTSLPGLGISAVAPSSASATLTLSHTGADFDAAGDLAVRVLDGAHQLAGALTTGTVQVSPSLDAALSRSSLPLNESPSGGGNIGAYTLVLSQAPAAALTVTVASGDAGAVTVSPPSLIFDASNWSSPQALTATALQDDDAANESLSIAHRVAGQGLIATLAVTVADDDAGTVLLDANPSTAELDPGPLALDELSSARLNARPYSVRLSAAPSGSVRVTIANGDASALTLSSTALSFDASNWNVAQRVTATAAQDGDALDESVTLTHTASGGGYNGATARMSVTVADDERTGTDYDADEDGLIEISNLAQLNALRWDLDGNGAVWSGVAASYAQAFPGPSAGMGCPSVDGGAAACTGYELARDLDFDTDGDGDVDASDPGSFPSWTPIDNYEGFLEGNGRAISNLTINDSTTRFVGLFGQLASDGRVQNLGLPDASISATASRTEAGALAGRLSGTVLASHSSGSVAGNSSSSAQIGGLIGQMMAGSRLAASYSMASVSGSQNVGGLVGTKQAGQILASYAAARCRR